MSKRLTLFIVVFSAGMMAQPLFVLGATSTDVQKAVIQQQADQSLENQNRIDLEQQELAKPEIQMENNAAVPLSQGPLFRVNEIDLVGNTIFSTDQLRIYTDRYEGKKLHLKELQDLAMLITARYQMAGYMTSHAFVPPQKVYNGVVTIRIVEGRVGTITLSGNRYYSDKLYIERLLPQRGAFFDMQQLAMSLQDINQRPDRFVKAYLEPGEEEGTSNIILKAQDSNPLHASYEYNTTGTGLTHVSRDILHFTDNNLTGHGDTLQTSITMADQNSVLGGMVQYVLPVPKEGLTYTFNTGDNYSRLDKYLRALKVTSDSFYFSPGVTKNFIKAPSLSVDGYAGFEIKNSYTLVDKSKLSYDRDRVLDLGPRVAVDDYWGKTFYSGDVRVGIPDFLGGEELHDDDASRIDSGGEFAYLTGSIDRINRLPLGSYLVLHAGGQYSPMPLNSLEQFDLGGMSSVRGYPENDSSGDSGLNFSAELRIPPYFIPAAWHIGTSKDKTWRDAISLVTFLDGGRVFNYKRQNDGSEKDRTLIGTGVGVRYYVSPDMNIQAGDGFPIGDKSSDGKHVEPYVSARVGF